MKDFQELRQRVLAFVTERDWHQFHSPKNLSMALIVEAAELVEHFQWLTEPESGNLSPEKKHAVGEEMADILIYLTSLSNRLDIDLLSAAEAKIARNAEKYPVEKVKGKA